MKRFILGLFLFSGVAVAFAACVSPDGTTIPPATEISTADGSTWTVAPTTNEVLKNNTDTFQAAAELLFQGGNIFAKDSANMWHRYDGWVPVANPTVNPVPATITSAFLAANFHPTFGDNFASLSTICPNGTASTACKWYNGTEQCCMSPTPQPGNVGGAMYPTAVGPNGPFYPFSLTTAPDSGLTMTMHTQTTTGLNPNYTSVFSAVTTSLAADGSGFKQQYGYFEATMWVSPNNGTWPAFWMLSPSRDMEIDVIEQYGHDPLHYWATVSDYTIPISSTNRHPVEFPPAGQNLTTGYHTYGVLIDAGHVSFYFDRALMESVPTPPRANQAMMLLFDQGSGGGWPTCAGPMQIGQTYTVNGAPFTCPAGSAQLEGAVLKIQSINVWQFN